MEMMLNTKKENRAGGSDGGYNGQLGHQKAHLKVELDGENRDHGRWTT